MNIQFAQDKFKGYDGIWGGDIVDVHSPFAMRDKVMHFLSAGILQLLIERWTGLDSWWEAQLTILLAGVIIEVVEMIRYSKYGYTRSMSDKFSWKDLIANQLGALLFWLLV